MVHMTHVFLADETVTHGRWDGGREHASWAIQD
jgi:hypothetical protein